MIWAGIEGDGRTRVRGRTIRLAAAVIGLVAATLATPPAHAQFVCQDVALGTGDGATATGANSVACGTDATASDLSSTATGNFATASGSNSTATGAASTASGSGSTATGVSATASGIDSTAIGALSNATANFSTALGNSAQATGVDSTAVGEGSTAGGTGATAVGQGSRADGVNSIAIGQGAETLHDNAIAVGAGVQTSSANQVAIGNSSNTYTFAGITSAASQAAQTGPVQVVTSDANGNLATMDIASLGGDLSGINSRLDQHDKKISKNTEGVAIALAMAGVPTLTGSETFAVSANWGTFEGESGFAAGGAVRLNQNIQVNGGVGFGGETVGGRGGVRIGW